MTQVYQPGNKVYAKLRGYPWWPARIEDESELPSSVLAQKPKGSQKVWSVRFFGTRDYAWMPPRQLREFDKQLAEESLEKLKGKRKEKLLERSFMEALDLVSNIDGSDDEEADATPESSNNEMDVDGVSKRSSDSSHEESTEERPKGRGARSRRNSKSASTASTKQNTAKSGTAKSGSAKSGTTKSSTANTKSTKRRHRKIDYTDDEEEPMDIDQNGKDEGKDKIRNQSSKKRRRMSKDKSNEQVSNSDETGSDGKSESGAGEGPNGPDALDEESGANAKSKKSEAESNARSGKTPKASTPTEKLVHLRHKLQKLTLKDPVMDQVKVDQLFGEVESFSITIPLLKESKMGKLMKKIAAKNIDPDPYKIKDRCTDLMKKWKCLLESSSQEPAEETTSPKADGKT
ncbi:4595_t:CDS:2 [Paraglomus brasilianum]|uniref:4595_t:CDS:1 n=1 Tax=Paraglomus brasilianum TaxID=144538 RepID=A0A9N9G342_9GLOM|nr:4595_t:CDS:2 [Paraglomus brasilianum]